MKKDQKFTSCNENVDLILKYKYIQPMRDKIQPFDYLQKYISQIYIYKIAINLNQNSFVSKSNFILHNLYKNKWKPSKDI